MKSIFIFLLVFLYSIITYSQDIYNQSTNKHSFEVEGLALSQKFSKYYGFGIGHKYSFNQTIGLRHSIRYLSHNNDVAILGEGKASFRHLMYSIEGVLSFGKSKTWNTSFGISLENQNQISGQDYIYNTLENRFINKNNFGLQMGIGKSFQLNGKYKLNLGYSGSYFDGLRNGIRLSYIIP